MFEDNIEFSDNSVLSEEYILECLKTIRENNDAPKEDVFRLLKNPSAVRYFKYHVDYYCEIHELTIKKIETSEEFFKYLTNETIFEKSIIERDEFYYSFLNTLLLPLIEASAKFNDNVVCQETVRIIGQCVFRRTFKELIDYLGEQFEQKESTRKCKLCRALFKFITHSLYPSDVSSIGLKLIFNAFTNTYYNFELVYKFLIVLTQMIGFNVQDDFKMNKLKYQISDGSMQKSLIILNELLDVITQLPKIDPKCSLNEITFNTFIKNILQSLIALTSNPNKDCYEILLKIIKIDPLITETLIQEIVMYAMLGDNSDCEQEYEQFMAKVFEIFAKLHRIQKLISKMIPTLQMGLENRILNQTVYTFIGNTDIKYQIEHNYNVDYILPKNVLVSLTNRILYLPSNQVIALIKTLHYCLNSAVEELPEIKGENKLIYIEIVSTLTRWVLLNVRIAEHTVPSHIIEKFLGCLAELRTTLGKFGVALLHKEHNHILMRTFLNICYYWAEIFVVLEYYSPNDSVKMTKVIDNNLSPGNLTYLHSYLSSKEWCLIFERITNFGEKPCKEIMQKLLIQKIKALMIFEDNSNEDVIMSIIRTLSLNFEADFIEIFTDRFMVNKVLDKMPLTVVTSISEVIFKSLYDDKINKLTEQIYDSELLISGILTVLFPKINKLLKQKRKHDESTVKMPCFSQVFSILPADLFLSSDIEQYFEKASIMLVMREDGQHLDLKINDGKIQKYLEILRKLPLLFCNEKTQTLIVLLLMSLHRDLKESNSEIAVKKDCESLILSIIQYNKLLLLHQFNVEDAVKMLIRDFERCEDLFFQFTNNAFKNDEYIEKFQPGIEYIESNIKDLRHMRLAVIVINILRKAKKSKITPESKELCSKYQSSLCNKVAKIILKKTPQDPLIEPYAVILKTYLSKDDDNTSMSNVESCWQDYTEYCLKNLNENNLKGGLLLFVTVLHHKSVLPNFDDMLVLKIWNTLKTVSVKDDISEEYSQLIMLTTSLIPNDQFLSIFEDLLKTTEKSINEENDTEFLKNLKTWKNILSTNYNPVKTNVLREQLELFLEKLIVIVKCKEYKEDLFEEVIQFEVSIIQAVHVPLTSVILDYLLLSVTFLMSRKTYPFVHTYNMSMLILENLLKHRNPLIMDRLPPYLMQYMFLLKELCKYSDADVHQEQIERQKFADCAHKLEKLTNSLAECTKDMSRISMYLIADILGQYELVTLYPIVKKHLDNCIYSLIALCDQHAIQYLMRILSEASTEIFKIMYENYKKYYRFTGKV